MKNKFELLAFYSNPKTLDALIKAQVDGIIVDWERKGKSNRQSLYNTQINEHTSEDLKFVSQQNVNTLICRINGPTFFNKKEIDQAIDLGATELLLPMIKSEKEVEKFLNYIDNRVKVGIMLETNEALTIVDKLNQMPIHRFFVGLNDLAIQRKASNIFLPFIDGTIDMLRPRINKKFGIAGLTHPILGDPIPCSCLIKLMKKHNTSFSFLRRSFYKDVSKFPIHEILTAIRKEFEHHNDNYALSSEEEKLFSQKLI